jgi:DNA-directed RNA polymerase subunit RPC12/RpoP
MSEEKDDNLIKCENCGNEFSEFDSLPPDDFDLDCITCPYCRYSFLDF